MIRWAVRSVEIYVMMASAAAFVASERTLFAGSQPSPLFAASPRCAGGKAQRATYVALSQAGKSKSRYN